MTPTRDVQIPAAADRTNRVITYSHLRGTSRAPTEYELVTSKLHYYVGKGFEVSVPIQQWYRQHQDGSPLRCRDWEAFQDPRSTTYMSYTGLQRQKEASVDKILRRITDTGYDLTLPMSWLKVLEHLLPALRYPCHGLHMVSAYIGHMAPGGRITVASLFQAGDEVRRVQRLAYRLRQIQSSYPEFGQDSKTRWQTDPLWQPLRSLVEKLLVTYDWGEAFVAHNLVVKPLFDRFFMRRLADAASTNGDPLLSVILASLFEDCSWHQDWSQALLRTALADTPSNKETVATWTNTWRPLALQALRPFMDILGDENPA